MKLAIFYHCLFYHGDPSELRWNACEIIAGQMEQMEKSGLTAAADEIICGINGPVPQSCDVAGMILPRKAKFVFHGPESFAENLTIVELEKWLRDGRNPDEWLVLYFHAKGSSHTANDDYGNRVSKPWREAMMHHLVTNWRQCAADLQAGIEACGCNWMTGMVDGTQNIFGGNFWWARGSYLKLLPSIYLRDRIKMSGIAAAASRYEAEVWIGNGPRLPSVRVYHPGGM